MKDDRNFEVHEGSYRTAGFSSPQSEVTHNYDRDREDFLIKSCVAKVIQVFDNPNKFERRLAKHEHIPIQEPRSRDIYYNIIFTEEPEYYCAGSGGVGSAKVFWTPYTSEKKEASEKVKGDKYCDNCKTLAHESQHAIGSNAEFDSFSSLPMFYNRLDNFPKGERLEYELSIMASVMAMHCKEGIKEPYQRSSRNLFCAIESRYPELLREMLIESGHSNEFTENVIDCACR